MPDEAPLPDCAIIAHAWAQFEKANGGSSTAFDADGWTMRGRLNERLFKGLPASVREVFYRSDVMEAKDGASTTLLKLRPLGGAAAARDLLVAHGACAPIDCVARLVARKRRRSAGTVASAGGPHRHGRLGHPPGGSGVRTRRGRGDGRRGGAKG